MPFDPLTLVFAVVAALIAWKLYTTLGQPGGFGRERPPTQPTQPSPFTKPFGRGRGNRGDLTPVPSGSNVVRLPGSIPVTADPQRWRAYVETNDAAVTTGLDAIAAADASFSAGPFVDGARTAYEAVVTAFASGERRTLQNLLVRDVYDGFNGAILDREKKGERLSTTFVSVDDAKIRAAALDKKTARVTLRFLSKQITATYGADGELKNGSPDRINDMDDIWTFERVVTSRDPNWKLVATESGH